MQTVNRAEKGRPWLLLLTAVIWGTGFVAQSAGSESVPTFTFCFLRNIIAAAALVPVIVLTGKLQKKGKTEDYDRKDLLQGGIVCGCVLFAASNSQQYAFEAGSTAGNAGFITACYILIVPLLGLFLKRKCGWNIWVSVGIALAGLYFLCIDGPFVLQRADCYLFACAFLFAVHILAVDHFTAKADGLRLSALQFLVCGLLSGLFSVFTDLRTAGSIAEFSNRVFTSGAWFCILYAGIVSSGAGYTLQVVGQKNVHPTVASLLMSLESVFSVLFGWLLLSERMSSRELAGCALVFAAVIFSQLHFSKAKEKKG